MLSCFPFFIYQFLQFWNWCGFSLNSLQHSNINLSKCLPAVCLKGEIRRIPWMLLVVPRCVDTWGWVVQSAFIVACAYSIHSLTSIIGTTHSTLFLSLPHSLLHSSGSLPQMQCLPVGRIFGFLESLLVLWLLCCLWLHPLEFSTSQGGALINSGLKHL